MKIFRIAVFLLINVLLAGYGFYTFKTSCYKNTRIILEITGGVPDRYQLFYNAGFGIKERESVNFSLDSINTGKIEFEIPGSWFRQLRIDPGTRPALLRIGKMSITHANHQICFEGKNLSQVLIPLNNVEMWFENDELIIQSIGNDPQTGFTGDLRQFVNLLVDWRKVLFLTLKVLLLFAGTFVAIFYFAKTRNWLSASFPKLSRWMCILGSIKPQRIFVYAAIFWGLITVFITPPFQSPDEFMHFFRVYQVSRLKIMPVVQHNIVGGYVPIGIVTLTSGYQKIPFHPENKVSPNQILNDFSIPLNPEKSVFMSHINSCQYIPVPYIPQAVFVLLPAFCNAPPLWLFYAGRLGNLIFWIILVYIAVSVTPVFKWVFVVLALLPMSVFQASSLSPDAFTNGLSFLFVALMLNCCSTANGRITLTKMVAMVTLAFFLSLSKNVYFVITAAILLIPLSRFSSTVGWAGLITGTLVAALSALILTHLYLNQTIGQLDISNGLYSGLKHYPQNIHPYKQLNLILQDLPGYASVLINTFIGNRNALAVGWVGNLGWHDTPLPVAFVCWVILLQIIIALVDNNEGFSLKVWQKILILTIVGSVFTTVGTTLYLSWTPLGESLIRGIQGRYLFPAGILLFLLLYNRKLRPSPNFIPTFVLVNIVVFFVVMMFTLLSRFYF